MKTVLLGLDGCTWSILRPLAEKGVMHNLAKLMKQCSWGILRSTIPPITGAAWPSLATGLNPGKTGIVDFLGRKGQEYRLYPADSSWYRGYAFWDLLSVENKRIAVFFYPLTYPPYPIKGVLVSGIGTPSLKPKSYPQEVTDEILSSFPDFRVYVDYHDEKYNDVDLFISDVMRHLEITKRMVKSYVLGKYGLYDNITFIVSATDWIQHRLWHLMDPKHPLYHEEQSKRYSKKIDDLWSLVDETVGFFAEYAHSEKAYLMIVSDHGFGSNLGVFNLARWLVTKGYMKLRRGGSWKASILSYGIRIAKKLRADDLAKRVLRGRVREYVQSLGLTGLINFTESKAIALGHSITFGGIYVLKSKEREKLIDELTGELKKIPEEFKIDVGVNVYRREDLYSGDKLKLLPDLIIGIDDWSFSITEDLHSPLLELRPWSPRHTGAHRPNGIFLLCGPSVKRHAGLSVSIYDVAPTILYLHKAPIPGDVDGRPLSKLLSNAREPRYISRSYYNTRIKIFQELRRKRSSLH
ncbi:conserved hypothetical protein [Aeropyrum pernix K1]|uniref:Type I phosphodiesterase/nucleotide pyrophosphatase n=1 Tax=Aeropyrum pernix (strain ATCC 700893 / DSM 11879 / JCM 9820 / NBRC 100138 / K1) TaxID=272557 RepID=Q9YCS9_AERPE|nr:alkaline phosphatase family protein [Aeropyrum pernix]BAA80168.1 conserved hypothetical protein [Aeropyrum pernix K1]